MEPAPVSPVQAVPVAVVESQQQHQSATVAAEPPKPSEPEENWDEEPPPTTPVKKPLTPPPTESLVSLSPESISAEEEEAEREREECGDIVEPFEPILSDEDIMADDAGSVMDFEYDTSHLEGLYALTQPDFLELEELPVGAGGSTLDASLVDKLRETIRTLSKSVANFNNLPGQEKETFVHNCESLCANLAVFDLSLSDFNNLSSIVSAGLDTELAKAQPQPAYKVRHVKMGVRLAEALCKLEQGPEILLKVNAPFKLLALCMRENVALPVKLSAIRALDAALISPTIVKEFLKPENNLYKLSLLMLESAKLARLKYALSSLLRKIHVFELLDEMDELTDLAVTELTNAYTYAPTLMAQPKRQLPASAQMEFEREHGRNPQRHLVAYFSYHKLPLRLLLLLTAPESSVSLIKAIRTFFLRFSSTKEGLLCLTKEPAVTKLLLKALRYDQPGLGRTIAWRLQVVQCLLQIKYKIDDWVSFKKLHSFLVYLEGLQAVVAVLPTDNFIDILLPSLSDENLCEFASEIIAAVVRYSDRVQVFQSRAKIILEKTRDRAIIRDVMPYLNVLSQPSNWNYNDVSSLVAIMRKNADRCAQLPRELIAACRILHYMVFPSSDDVDPMEPYVELKHTNALTQLFAADGLTALVLIMTKIAEFYEQPFLHRAALIGRRGMALVSLLTPCIKLTKAMLERLIKCMTTDFKDLTVVAPLLGVYSLVDAVAPSRATHVISTEIVETLLLFTQAVDADGSGNIAKSLWTQMLGEVLKMISLSPCNFTPGLRLFTRLLPPILTEKDGLNDDATRALGLRKLWSAHLQAQASNLTETLKLLCSSWNRDLLELLSTVCKQLSDLAAPTALLVGRCLLDGVLVTTPLENNVLLIALLGDLAKHAPVKATLLTLTSPTSRAQVKSDQKYPPVIEMLCSTLRNTNDVNVQYEILHAFETLCNCSLSLVQDEANEPLESRLMHSVPSKEPLLTILTTLIEILASAKKYHLDILQITLDTLTSLTLHNYGLYHVKSCFENHPDALKSLLEFVSTSSESEEAKSIVGSTITFLESLTSCKTPGRSLYLRSQQLAALISWEKSNHPLEKLQGSRELVETLKSADEKEEKEPIPEMLEPLLPTPDALLNQFSQRSLKASDRVSRNPRKRKFNPCDKPHDERCVDLLALATELLPADFNLLAEAQLLTSKVLPDDTAQSMQSKSHEEGQESREPQKTTNVPVTKIKQPFGNYYYFISVFFRFSVLLVMLSIT